MIDIINKMECTGCTACFNSCPVQCIKLEKDKEGFFYPVIDALKCINCNTCEKVCPTIFNRQDQRSNNLIAYACQNKNDNVRKISTSGGAFGAIANYVLSKGGVVWGVAFDDNARVVHKKVSCLLELPELFGSKYVQSQLNRTFFEIKETLKRENVPVLFVGTPCQVEGLYYMLNDIDVSNLITIDLVCYGVPSPGLYEKWILRLSQKYESQVTSVNFRDKKYGYSGVNVRVNFKNGQVVEDCYDAKSYGKTMFSHIGLRPSCYKCQFRKKKKLSDITLGDFWEIGEYSSDLDDDRGTSILNINSNKGQEIFDAIKYTDLKFVMIKEIEGEELEEEIKAKAYELSIPENRADFFRDSTKMEYEDLMKKYLPITKKEIAANMLKPVILKMPFSKLFFKRLKKWKMQRGK